MKVNLDRTSSGFCIGVQGTIHVAEEKLARSGSLYSLGDVVHNEVEVKRLEAQGLVASTGTPQEFAALIRKDLVLWRRIVKEAGIKPET